MRFIVARQKYCNGCVREDPQLLASGLRIPEPRLVFLVVAVRNLGKPGQETPRFKVELSDDGVMQSGHFVSFSQAITWTVLPTCVFGAPFGFRRTVVIAVENSGSR